MRIDKEQVKERPSEKAEYFGEFSKTEIASLFPASELLHKIHTDHVYTTNEYSECHNAQEADDTYDYNHQDDILSLNADSIQQVFQRMINMTSLNSIGDQANDDTDDTEANSDTENSQRKTPVIKKVKFVEDLPGPSGTQPASTSGSVSEVHEHKARKHDRAKESNRKKTRSCRKESYSHSTVKTNTVKDVGRENKEVVRRSRSKSLEKGKETTVCKSVTGSEWRTASKCAEVEREMNTLIQFTAELLVRRWGEYLSMTAEQISAFEIENAKQHKMVVEVIDMLEDKDRYVWQLIEELQFF